MFRIRPIALKDEGGFKNLVYRDSVGITTLPHNYAALDHNIHESMESFAKEVEEPGKETYVFVLEDLKSGVLGGTCRINARTGVDFPDYFYKIEQQTQVSEILRTETSYAILNPIGYSNGPSKICGLYMCPTFRHHGLGHLLSLSRFLFIAAFQQRFTTHIIAEMRGVIDRDGASPFWDGLGRHFLNIDYKELLNLIQRNKAVIPELLPKYPIYQCLLPETAQKVIGEIHPDTQPALNMLVHQGFYLTDEIDLFDGGPKIESEKNKIHVVKQSRLGTVATICDAPLKSELFLIGNVRSDFHCCEGALLESGEDAITIDRITAHALDVSIGDPIIYVNSHPRHAL